MPIHQFVVTVETEGVRLDVFLTRALDHSRNQIARWIKAGHATVEGAVVPARKLVLDGQEVELQVPEPPPSSIIPQPMDLTIVYRDAHVLVVDKPAGVIVHPGAGHPDGTLINGVLALTGVLSPIGLPDRPGVVHRIDAGTSGLLVLALDEVAHHGLAAQFAAHTCERRYDALVWDHGVEDEGTIRTPYGRHIRDRRKFTGKGTHAREAVTHWTVRTRKGPCAWLSLRLETGRTHQIRVHLSEAGSPILGDTMYGRRRRIERPPLLRQRGFELGLTRQALHAATLGFEHPITGEALRFESKWPEDLLAADQALEGV